MRDCTHNPPTAQHVPTNPKPQQPQPRPIVTARAEAVICRAQALYIQRQCVFVDLHVNIWALWPRQSKGIGCDKAPNKGTSGAYIWCLIPTKAPNKGTAGALPREGTKQRHHWCLTDEGTKYRHHCSTMVPIFEKGTGLGTTTRQSRAARRWQHGHRQLHWRRS